jgi:hypothetical protein
MFVAVDSAQDSPDVLTDDCPAFVYPYDTNAYPADVHLETAFSEVESLYKAHFSSVATRFPALYGHNCLDDPNSPDPASSVYRVRNHHHEIRQLFDVYERSASWNEA